MAGIVLEKLEDQLSCSICLDTYTNPKQLQCHHVYCQQCLVKQTNPDQHSLTCPNCRQVTPVPASGVAGLQPAFHANQLLEIVEEHKKESLFTTSVESISARPAPHSSCPEHGREVELYCETCEETICWKCIKRGERHRSHDYEEMEEAFERYKEEMVSSLEPLEKNLMAVKMALSEVDERCGEISDQQRIIEADIHNDIARLHETLDYRKTELIGQLHQLTQAKLKSLAIQRNQLKATQAQLCKCLGNIRESLQAKTLLLKSTISQQVKELTATCQPDMLIPDSEADMIYSALENLSAECQNHGKVYTAGPPDPAKCCVTGNGVDTATTLEASTAILHTLNSPCSKLGNSISCEVVSETAGTTSSGYVERKGRSQYEIRYHPTTKGWHQLHIKMEGQAVKGSPFLVCAKSPVEELGTPVLTIEGLKVPQGVAVNQRGEVVVTENSGHCVSVFSPNGKRLRSFGRKGSGFGQFKNPYGVAIDSRGNMLISDNNNHRIQKFTAQGKFLSTVGTRGSRTLQFNRPFGITFNKENDRVYVVENGNNRVQILNSDLSYCGSFGEKGRDSGQFDRPQYIACDSTGNVYVTSSGNHCVQAFTAEGEFLKIFGGRGEGMGELKEPMGVAIDANDRVYVGDNGNHRISVFTSDGKFVKSFGSEGEGPGQFTYPYGVAVDSCGIVYVSDIKGRVQLF